MMEYIKRLELIDKSIAKLEAERKEYIELGVIELAKECEIELEEIEEHKRDVIAEILSKEKKRFLEATI
jgi:hypothetical protein